MTASTETPAAGMTRLPAAGAKPLPPHGTAYRYVGRAGFWPGCRCSKCTRAHTRAGAQRALAHLRGEPPLHPAGPVVAHVRALNESGMSTDLVARRAGVSPNTLGYVLRGFSKTCRRATALKVLAVQPGDYDEVAEVPSIGSSRRLQALYAMGHGPQVLAAATGLHPSSITHIASGKVGKVAAATATAIRQVYAQLAAIEGTGNAARRRAAQMGWRDPLWWEDWGHIDDPAFNPATAEQELSRDELAALRRKEIEHLVSYGYESEQIAERLDLGISTVRAIVQELRTGDRRDRRQGVAA